jgi:hypothetical protein
MATSKQSKPAIVQAKENTPPMSPSFLMGVKQVAENLPTQFSEALKSKYPNGRVLEDLFNINTKIGNRELLNTDLNASPAYREKYKNAKTTDISNDFESAKKSGATGQKEISLTRGELPVGIMFDNSLKEMYNLANQRGIKSRDEFVANYDELLKTQPQLKQLLQEVGGPESSQMPIKPDILKQTAAEQYQRLLNTQKDLEAKRLASKSQQPSSTTPSSTTTPTTTPTVKLSVNR